MYFARSCWTVFIPLKSYSGLNINIEFPALNAPNMDLYGTAEGCILRRRAESHPSLERATKYNPVYESEATAGYRDYHRRYAEAAAYSSASAEASTDFSSEEIRHIYENSELTKEVCVCVCTRM